MKRERGGVVGLLLCMLLGAVLVTFLVYRFYLGKDGGPAEMAKDVGGVKVERGIQSVEKANSLIQKTKKTLEDQTKQMEDKVNGALDEAR